MLDSAVFQEAPDLLAVVADVVGDPADAADYDAAADAAADASADAYDAADADDIRLSWARSLLEESAMEDGLYLIQIPVTYYRAVTIVGWLRRLHGDEYEIAPGGRVVSRQRGSADWNGIAKLAENGPGDDYKLYEPMRTSEPLHRLTMRRPKPCIEAAWIKHVPRPADWGGAA